MRRQKSEFMGVKERGIVELIQDMTGDVADQV